MGKGDVRPGLHRMIHDGLGKLLCQSACSKESGGHTHFLDFNVSWRLKGSGASQGRIRSRKNPRSTHTHTHATNFSDSSAKNTPSRILRGRILERRILSRKKDSRISRILNPRKILPRRQRDKGRIRETSLYITLCQEYPQSWRALGSSD